MTDFTFRQATPADARRIEQIILQAKARMRARGSSQWQGPYPAAEDIARDIACGAGWVLTRPEGQEAIAYGAVIFTGEAAYQQIEGAWLDERDYVVVHRLAVADEALQQGVASDFFRQTEALARSRKIGSFRVDTNFDNAYMLRLLEAQGFTLCGKVYYESGERLAFEKLF